VERPEVLCFAAHLDRLTQFYFADAFFEMAKNTEQFFGRKQVAVIIAFYVEDGADELLEFRTEKCKPTGGVGDINRGHAVEQIAREQDFGRPGNSPVRCCHQSRFETYDRFQPVVQGRSPTIICFRKYILDAATSWYDGQKRSAYFPSFVAWRLIQSDHRAKTTPTPCLKPEKC
jgi:hypothetical protein